MKPFVCASLALPLIASSLASGCSPNDPSVANEGVGASASAIISGSASGATQDEVILLLHYDPSDRQNGFGECSGALIAPNVVLTARHCVSQTDQTAACGANGVPVEGGGKIYRQHKANTMYVFTGSTRPDFHSQDVNPAGQGAQLFVPQADNLCNNDIAILVLAADVAGAKVARIRLDPTTAVGETITSVGWGLDNSGGQPNQRMQRSGIAIDALGPQLGFGANEFEVGESICSGDSGGPALSEKTGAIIGVVSRGGNGSNGSSPSAQCIGTSTRNIYTQTPPFKELILQAFSAAGATPTLEGETPAPPTGAEFGEACADNDACASALCLMPKDADEGMCTQACDDATKCPSGYSCSGDGYCVQKAKSSSSGDDTDTATTTKKKKNAASDDSGDSGGAGCSSGGSSTPSGSLGVLLGLGIALFVRRRRPC